MIKPTVGRVVLFWPDRNMTQPYAATVAYVHSDRLINISFVDHAGRQAAATSVPLAQPEDTAVPESQFCEWMPFQKGQAGEKQVGAGG